MVLVLVGCGVRRRPAPRRDPGGHPDARERAAGEVAARRPRLAEGRGRVILRRMTPPPVHPAEPRPRLTVLIPTWQEAPLVADAVHRAARIGCEVIVADGGSPDGTAEIARRAGARVVTTPKGRGPQLNAGAAAARGAVLLVLHADARLPPRARGAIEAALADARVAGGAFYLRFLPASWFTRLLEPANHLRRLVVRRTYGDCAIFVRAAAWERLGGVRPWPVMHDFDLTARMRRLGGWAYLRDPCVFAADRRFHGREWRTLGLWIAVRTLYRLGVPPARLGRLYPDARGRDEAFLSAVADALRAEGSEDADEGRRGGG